MKYELQVGDAGRVEFQVPFPTGTNVIVFVVPDGTESFEDLTAAATSSLGFWDNPLDDEDWNEA